MSQMPATARTAPRAPRRAEPSRPQLRVVQAAPQRPRRLPFVLLCSFVLAAGLALLLFLNLSLARGSYALHDLQKQSTMLSEQEEARREVLASQEAPTVLAQRATELGMVQGVSPAFLRLPDGQVLGVPQKAGAPQAPAAGAAGGQGAEGTGGTEGTEGTEGAATPAPSAGDGADAAAPSGAATGNETTSNGTGAASAAPTTR